VLQKKLATLFYHSVLLQLPSGLSWLCNTPIDPSYYYLTMRPKVRVLISSDPGRLSNLMIHRQNRKSWSWNYIISLAITWHF